MTTPTMLRELRSLRLRLGELAKQDEEALAEERRICEVRLALAEAAMKLRKPLEACLLDLGYPPVVAGNVLNSADELRHSARLRLDELKPLLPPLDAEMLVEEERRIERELDQWR